MADAHPTSRQDRLKAALRDNLRRRKAQARGRSDVAGDEPSKPAPDTPPESRRDETP